MIKKQKKNRTRICWIEKRQRRFARKHSNLWDKRKSGMWKKTMIAKERRSHEKWKRNHDVPAKQS